MSVYPGNKAARNNIEVPVLRAVSVFEALPRVEAGAGVVVKCEMVKRVIERDLHACRVLWSVSAQSTAPGT